MALGAPTEGGTKWTYLSARVRSVSIIVVENSKKKLNCVREDLIENGKYIYMVELRTSSCFWKSVKKLKYGS